MLKNTSMKIVLCGYMGSGKSVIGRLLASDLEMKFVDLDAEIEASEQKKIPEIFSEKSEIFFRKKETEVLKTLLNSSENQIIALGGGTPCYGNNLEILKNDPEVLTIYLKVGFKNLVNRLFGERKQRPLIAHLDTKDILEDFVRKHLFERQYYYLQSDEIIETTEYSISECVAEIKRRLYRF